MTAIDPLDTVVGLVGAIADGQMSALEAFDRAAARIEGDRHGAVVWTDLDRARQRVLDGLPVGPLHGLPYLVKDLHAEVAGWPLHRGSRLLARHGRPDTVTSTLVQRLLDAGVVLLGRTSSPEFGLNLTTEPALHGPTRNPLAPDRSAGGSSGGSAAAVAAALVPAAHGSDSGGSLRIPAAWCGVVGFKPSRGVNPLGPVRRTAWAGLSHEHAMTRTVGDSVRLLAVTAGADPGDAHQRPGPAPASRERPLRVGLLTAHPSGDVVDPACRAAAVEAAVIAEQHGHVVLQLTTPDRFAGCGPAMAPIIAADLARVVDDALDGIGDPSAEDLLEPAVAELVRRGRAMSAAELLRAVVGLRDLAAALVADLAGVDVVLTPATATVAPLLGTVTTARPAAELFGEIFRRSPFLAAFNVIGGPALSLPWATTPEGTAVGVHVAGPQGTDALVLGLATQLEAAHPWPVAPR